MNIEKIIKSIESETDELNKLLKKKTDTEAKIEEKSKLLEQKHAALNKVRLKKLEDKLSIKGVSLEEVVDAVVSEDFISLQRKIDSRELALGTVSGNVLGSASGNVSENALGGDGA